MQYLFDIAHSAGVREIVLGNLFIGGCDLQMHYSNASGNKNAYRYYKNTAGSWGSSENRSILYGLKDENWDYIVMQQASPLSGVESSYNSDLTGLITYINNNKTNPKAKLLWHMTWAYQSDSTHSAFPTYQKNQMTMYNMIISANKNKILTNGSFYKIIPSGTAVQNTRTSFIGDTLTRDGYHLSNNIGRYIAALTWFAEITRLPLDTMTFNPAPKEITEEHVIAIREAVENAIEKPFEITESQYKKNKHNSSINDPVTYASDKILAADKGINLDNYTFLEYTFRVNSYWNSTSRNTITSASSAQNNKFICVDKRYTREELPLNSIIICDLGWNYRPEAWANQMDNATVRGVNTTANFTVIDAAWWGSNHYFSFNISKADSSDISQNFAQAAKHFRIYIPK